jgi:hypothetical protein
LNLLTQSQPITADQIAAKLDVYLKQDKPNVIVFGTKYDDKHNLENDHYGLQRAMEENKPSRGIDENNTYVAFFFCFDSQCKTER